MTDSSPSRRAKINKSVNRPYSDKPPRRAKFLNKINGLAERAAGPPRGRLCAPIFIRTWAAAPINVQKNTSPIDSRRVSVRRSGLTKVEVALLKGGPPRDSSDEF